MPYVGANAAVLLAAKLDKARIPVALIVLYDTVSSMKVTGNVRRVAAKQGSILLEARVSCQPAEDRVTTR